MAIDPIKFQMAREMFQKTLERVKLNFDKQAVLAMTLWSSGTINDLAVKRMSGRPGVNRLSGNLARSFRHQESGSTLADAQTRIYSTAIYSRVQEYGATIRPVRARKLAIPIPGSPAMRANGEALFHSPLRASLAGQGIFRVKDVLATRAASGKGIVPWFALKDSVYVPPRLKFSETVKARLRVLRSALGDAFNAAKKGS
jgi:hypothetical protein